MWRPCSSSASGVTVTDLMALSLAANQRCNGRNFGSTSFSRKRPSRPDSAVEIRPSRVVSVMKSGRISGIGVCQDGA